MGMRIMSQTTGTERRPATRRLWTAAGIILAGVVIIAGALGYGGTIRAANYQDAAIAWATTGLGSVAGHASQAAWWDAVLAREEYLADAARGQVQLFALVGVAVIIVGGVLLYRNRRRQAAE